MRRAAALLAALALAGCASDDATPGSTLERTVGDPDGNGDLTQTPAEPLVDRTELAPRGDAPDEVVRFGQLTDTHVRDEESPARVPFLDRLGNPVASTFRPQEALSAQVLGAAIRALNDERPQALFFTGDLIDNAQRNELDAFLRIVAGGEVDPDSGAPGYDGVQDQANPDGFFYRPDVDAPVLGGLLDRAQRPFFTPGVRAPWFPALGNHDLLVQGEQPPSPAIDAIATGDRALQTYDPELADQLRQILPDDIEQDTSRPDLSGVPRDAIEQLLQQGVPSDDATTVPRDPARRLLTATEARDRLAAAAHVSPRTSRLDYVADVAPAVRAIVLDTVDRAGGADGVLTGEQATFLDTALTRAEAEGKDVVLVDHHGLDRTGGAAAQALRRVDRSPNVIAELTGDTHRNAIEPVRTARGGYWRITTSSLADWPQQTRMLRLVTGPGGDRALETWMVDHRGGYTAGDPAGAARELSYLDAQGGRPTGRAGRRQDRNARLWLPNRAQG